MIKWTGTDTRYEIKWTEETETYLELFYKLVKRQLIHQCTDTEGDTFHALLYFSKELEDLYKANDTEKIMEFDFDSLLKPLDDDKLKFIIRCNRGNAYYQEFKEM